MRKTRQVEIVFEDETKKSVLIKELSVRQIEGLMLGMDLRKLAEAPDALPENLKLFFQDQLIPTCSNLTLEEVRKMFPSDLEAIISAIQEVNKSFFQLVVKLNLLEWAKGLIQMLTQIFLAKMVSGPSAAPSLKQDTLSQPTTDIHIS